MIINHQLLLIPTVEMSLAYEFMRDYRASFMPKLDYVVLVEINNRDSFFQLVKLFREALINDFPDLRTKQYNRGHSKLIVLDIHNPNKRI